jgi:hypothetical protein
VCVCATFPFCVCCDQIKIPVTGKWVKIKFTLGDNCIWKWFARTHINPNFQAIDIHILSLMTLLIVLMLIF